MPQEPTVDVLLIRFHGEVQSVFYAFFVLSVIERGGPASKQEIKDEIFRMTRGMLDNEVASHNRLVGRLEKTFGLIEPVAKERDAARMRYQLTDKGRQLYSQSLEQIVYPLGDALPAP